jgi:hypothetical protein
VVGAEPAQLAFALADLAVELVDQAQARLDRALPRFVDGSDGTRTRDLRRDRYDERVSSSFG